MEGNGKCTNYPIEVKVTIYPATGNLIMLSGPTVHFPLEDHEANVINLLMVASFIQKLEILDVRHETLFQEVM